MKYCPFCDTTLPAERFCRRTASPDGLNNKCRACAKAACAMRYASDPEFVARKKANAKNWATQNAERRKEIRDKSAFKHRAKKQVASKVFREKKKVEDLEGVRMGWRLAAERRRHSELEAGAFKRKWQIGKILKTAGGVCQYCLLPTESLTIDHFTPVSKGGSGEWTNLIPCCKSCNSSKKDKDGPSWIEKNFGIERLIEVCRQMESMESVRLP